MKETRKVGAVLRSIAVLVVALGVATGGASAQEDTKEKRKGGGAVAGKKGDRKGFFVGVAGNWVNWNDHEDANDDGSLSGISATNSDFGWKVYGGYSFNKYVELEAGYQDLGNSSFDATSAGGPSWIAGPVTAEVDSKGWTASATGKLPVSERWSLFLRVGVYGWETTETFTENGGITSQQKDSGTDATYGVGAEWDVGHPDDVVLRGELARTQTDADGLAVDTLSLGARWQF